MISNLVRTITKISGFHFETSIMPDFDTASRDTTPPHHPTHGVHLSDTQIRSIIATAIPGSELTSCQQIPRGSSFNNRVYLLQIISAQATRELVLKVSGRVWRGDKVQNEVAAHLIVNHFCPEVPLPEIVAWSEDGVNCTSFITHRTESQPIDEDSSRPWVLMTRAEGRPITEHDLKGSHGKTLVSEIAAYVASWRSKIPPASVIGNLRLGRGANFTPYVTIQGVDISVAGCLFCVKPQSRPLETALAFYEYKINDQFDRIAEDPVFRGWEVIMKPLAERLLRVIRRLPMVTSQDVICFTHYDISPSNILIMDDVDSGLRVSAFLDFEFAGFFPVEEDFTELLVNNPDRWPEPARSNLLVGVRENGIDIPSSEELDQVCTMCRIREQIAPWWLSDQHDIQQEIKDAERHIRDGLSRLESILTK